MIRRSQSSAHAVRWLTFGCLGLALLLTGGLPPGTGGTGGTGGAGGAGGVSANVMPGTPARAAALPADAGNVPASPGPGVAPIGLTSAPPNAVALPSPPSGGKSSKSEASKPESAEVRLGDSVLLTLKLPLGPRSPAERANLANEALKAVLLEAKLQEVRVETRGELAVVFVGSHAIVALSVADARSAGEVSLDTFATAFEEKVRTGIVSEKRRSAITKTAFSIALAIFLGLVGIYLLGKIRAQSQRLREWLQDNPERVPALKLFSFELLGPVPVQHGLQLAVGLGRWLFALGLLYAYLVGVLSLFESTRGFTARLTDLVVAPFSALTERLAQTLPVLLIAGFSGLAIFLLLRFVTLLFASVARGETQLGGVPRDFAQPLSVLLRTAIVLGAMLFVGPIVTGAADGPLSRTAMLGLAGLGLAGLPILATAAMGTATLFLRRFKVGTRVEFGGQRGNVLEVGVLDVRLLDAEGAEVRVPHLLGLVHATRLLGSSAQAVFELRVPRRVERQRLERALSDFAKRIQADVSLKLFEIDEHNWHYRAAFMRAAEPPDLFGMLSASLAEAEIEITRLARL